MRITITARHCEVPDELRARARRLVERLSRMATRPHDAQVLFDGAPRPQDGLIRPDLGRPGLGLDFKRADAARYAE